MALRRVTPGGLRALTGYLGRVTTAAARLGGDRAFAPPGYFSEVTRCNPVARARLRGWRGEAKVQAAAAFRGRSFHPVTHVTRVTHQKRIELERKNVYMGEGSGHVTLVTGLSGQVHSQRPAAPANPERRAKPARERR